jgi:hypothetical protein
MTNQESPAPAEESPSPPAPDPRTLEEKIGYNFRDRHLLERALTHRSWAHESVGAGGEREARALHNEAFEFVGDSVLGLVVADALFRSHPEVTEGELSRMKHRLVSAQTLARVARRLGLGEHLRVGRGEEKTGGRRKRALLADAFEALLAAVFLDGGYPAAEVFVRRARVGGGRRLQDAAPGAPTVGAPPLARLRARRDGRPASRAHLPRRGRLRRRARPRRGPHHQGRRDGRGLPRPRTHRAAARFG